MKYIITIQIVLLILLITTINVYPKPPQKKNVDKIINVENKKKVQSEAKEESSAVISTVKRAKASYSKYFLKLYINYTSGIRFRLQVENASSEDKYYQVYYDSNSDPLFFEYYEKILGEVYLIYRMDILNYDNLEEDVYPELGEPIYLVYHIDHHAKFIVNYSKGDISSVVYFNNDGTRSRYEIYENNSIVLAKQYLEKKISYVEYLNNEDKNIPTFTKLYVYDDKTGALIYNITKNEKEIISITHYDANGNEDKTQLYKNGVDYRDFFYKGDNDVDKITQVIIGKEKNTERTLPEAELEAKYLLPGEEEKEEKVDKTEVDENPSGKKRAYRNKTENDEDKVDKTEADENTSEKKRANKSKAESNENKSKKTKTDENTSGKKRANRSKP